MRWLNLLKALRRRQRPTPLELHQAYRRVFESEDGKTVLRDLVERGHVLHAAFSSDAGRTEFHEGQRSMVVHVIGMMDEDRYAQLHQQEKKA
jgi:hypothetical protein